MAGVRISRRKLSAYVADRLASGQAANEAISQVAAYLVETRQTHDVELLVRSIEEELMNHGVVVADVAAAHPLSEGIKEQIARLVDAKELHIRLAIEPDLLGGIRVDVPGKRFDATLKRKINLLKSVER